MSWSASFENKQALADNKPSNPFSASDDGVNEQYDAAREAATDLIESGALGDDSRDYTITLSGHSNANHAPAPGFANDAVYISITQRS